MTDKWHISRGQIAESSGGTQPIAGSLELFYLLQTARKISGFIRFSGCKNYKFFQVRAHSSPHRNQYTNGQMQARSSSIGTKLGG